MTAPTDAEVEAAFQVVADVGLELLTWRRRCSHDRKLDEAAATLRRALASLRSDVAAKDAEIAVLSKDLGRAATAANEWEVERDALKAQLDAAENRGFRQAEAWLQRCVIIRRAPDYYLTCASEIRAEADRREGK